MRTTSGPDLHKETSDVLITAGIMLSGMGVIAIVLAGLITMDWKGALEFVPSIVLPAALMIVAGFILRNPEEESRL